VVTYLLIAANVAVFALVSVPLGGVPASPADPAVAEYLRTMFRALEGRVPMQELARHVSAYDLFVFTHGFRPAQPAVGPLFISMFLHAGAMHLAGNMLFLWIYGDNVERRLGVFRYLLTYLGTGIAATLFHWAGAAGSDIPVVGASGAISGVLGCYFVFFPRNTVRLLWLLPPFLGRVVEVPARIVLGFYLLADNLLPYLVSGAEGGVAHGAHIGGFLAGLALAWASDRFAVSPAAAHYARARTRGGDVGALVAEGRWEDAAAAYFALSPREAAQALDDEHALALAGWLRGGDFRDAALVVLRRLVRDAREPRMRARAHAALGGMLLEDLDQPAPAYQHFRAALDVEADPEVVDAAQRGLAAIAARQKRVVGRRG
jgi:membrane associated rhomboid family serine protease